MIDCGAICDAQAIARFWSHTEPDGDCLLWTAGLYVDGYPKFWYQGRTVRGTRFAFTIQNGPIPDGLSVLHRCDRPLCVAGRHLWAGTQADNIRDCVAKGRHVAQVKPEAYIGTRATGARHGSHTQPERFRRRQAA